ncbi:NAD(P)-dependent oxidoreductase [Pseudomonas sp. xss_1]|uniref:NAD(P)-dependent oxidoreductase n=1 Tax=Pseudomonas sp. xss_1 TaxID=3367214 RepID=UPI00370B4578
MSMPKVLFIGLGMMGRPMAGHIAKAGYPLVVSDTNAEAVKELCAEVGAVSIQSLESLSDIDVIITMLPNSSIVEAVLLGDEGIAKRVKPGTVVIDMSSSEPLRTRELAADLEKLSVGLLDAPVSGGVKRAVSGTLAIMLGGEGALVEKHSALISTMGKITHVGPIGAGHAIKALNNYVSAAGLLATVEALHIGEKFGLDPSIMTDVLNTASGSNFATQNKVKQFMLSGTYASGFALQLMVKDLKIAVALGEQMDQPMKLGHECLDVWKEAAEESDARTDHTEMYRIVGHHG